MRIVNIKGKVIEIDSCIAELVSKLNSVGLETIASCCGHGKQPTNIALKDGREIVIYSYKQARLTEKLFPPIQPRNNEWFYTIKRKLVLNYL